jgi:4-aminobutyrate aminotransferase-like enzyme
MNNGVMNQDIQKAYDELFSAILKEQKSFQALKEADPDKANLIQEELKKYEGMRGKGFFFNYLSSGRGHGPFSELIDGSVKYDLIGAIGVNLMGHSHPQYIKGVIDAALVDTIMCGNLLTYQAPKNLTETLINKVKGSRLRNFWFSGSGSFANDVALKILWQKSQPKYELIAFKKTFAGRSIATQDITYNPDYRKGMPQSIKVHHAEHFDQNDPKNSLSNSLKSLDEILETSKGNITGLTIELVQGEGGFIYGPREYYRGICDWARDKEIKIWFDEVQTFGRTPELFSFQHFGLDEYADVVTIGKVLQGAGTLYTDEMNPAPGLIAGTFNGSIAGLTTGNRIISR